MSDYDLMRMNATPVIVCDKESDVVLDEVGGRNTGFDNIDTTLKKESTVHNDGKSSLPQMDGEMIHIKPRLNFNEEMQKVEHDQRLIQKNTERQGQ